MALSVKAFVRRFKFSIPGANFGAGLGFKDTLDTQT